MESICATLSVLPAQGRGLGTGLCSGGGFLCLDMQIALASLLSLRAIVDLKMNELS